MLTGDTVSVVDYSAGLAGLGTVRQPQVHVVVGDEDDDTSLTKCIDIYTIPVEEAN